VFAWHIKQQRRLDRAIDSISRRASFDSSRADVPPSRYGRIGFSGIARMRFDP
jgi:hypothetical protein